MAYKSLFSSQVKSKNKSGYTPLFAKDRDDPGQPQKSNFPSLTRGLISAVSQPRTQSKVSDQVQDKSTSKIMELIRKKNEIGSKGLEPENAKKQRDTLLKKAKKIFDKIQYGESDTLQSILSYPERKLKDAFIRKEPLGKLEPGAKERILNPLAYPDAPIPTQKAAEKTIQVGKQERLNEIEVFGYLSNKRIAFKQGKGPALTEQEESLFEEVLSSIGIGMIAPETPKFKPSTIGKVIEGKVAGKTSGVATKEAKLLTGESKTIKPLVQESKAIKPLVEQAKKFKSAEEFVKAQGTPVYHGTNYEKFDPTKAVSKDGQYGKGVYFATDKNVTKQYGNKTVEAFLENNSLLKIDKPLTPTQQSNLRKVMGGDEWDWSKNPTGDFVWKRLELTHKNPEEILKRAGIKGIQHEQYVKGGKNINYTIFDESAIKTKSQLTDIWKQATAVKSNSLAQEAKKYNSAEEFVKAQGETLYHGTSKDFSVFSDKNIGSGKGATTRGTWFTSNIKEAEAIGEGVASRAKTLYGGNGVDLNPRVVEAYGSIKNKKVIDIKGEVLLPDKADDIVIQASKDGNDAVVFKNVKVIDGLNADHTVIIDTKNIKTKSQLTDIWKKANKLKPAKDKPKERISNTKTKKKPLPQNVYEKNRTYKRRKRDIARQDSSTIIKSIKLGLDRSLGLISTRLKNINPEIKNSLRKFEFNTRKNTLEDTKKVKGLLDKTKKMTKEDYADFDLARKNGDEAKIEEIVKKYGIEAEYKKTREVLDDLYKRAEQAGYNVGYKENYNPRIINDREGFIQYFRGGKQWSLIDQSIKAKEDALQRVLTEDEKVTFINTLIRGYNRDAIALSETGNMKSRVIANIGAELNQYYMESNAALVKYIEKTNEAIESRKFFGKGRFNRDADINDSIGSYVLNLMADGKITAEQEIIVTDILRARFNARGTSGFWNVYKNLSYIDTMGSPTSAITQVGDLAWALYKGGIIRTAKGLYKAVRGKTQIKKEDVGIDNIAAEFDNPSKSSKAVNNVFKLVGLEKMDRIGKETLIESVITKYQSWAKNDNKKLNGILDPIFGKEAEAVKADLVSGDITENVKLLAFNELLDMQPVALSEMPEMYLKGGNGRIFYMLKTFTLKQFDVYRNEVFQKIKNPKTRVEGITNMVKLLSFFVIMNATADEIKDWLLGRKTSLKDRTVDNVLRAVGFSKYLTWKARTEGIGSAMARQILPPFKFIDSVYKDIANGVENGSEIAQSIPLGGKLYYWWFGKGQYKDSKKNKEGNGLLPTLPKLPTLPTLPKLQGLPTLPKL